MTQPPPHYIAFEGGKRIASGTLEQVVLEVRQTLEMRPHARPMVFDQSTSELLDFDHRGTSEQMLKKLAKAAPGALPDAPPVPVNTVPAGPGRPRLGVVAREVTLLPRHWEWLNSQPGGASVSLRKLVEQAKRVNQASDDVRLAREAAYRFMSAIAGDRTGFEEAARALFSADLAQFRTLLSAWPMDISAHLHDLAAPAFQKHTAQDRHHV